jgi:hypothetical protein
MADQPAQDLATLDDRRRNIFIKIYKKGENGYFKKLYTENTCSKNTVWKRRVHGRESPSYTTRYVALLNYVLLKMYQILFIKTSLCNIPYFHHSEHGYFPFWL